MSMSRTDKLKYLLNAEELAIYIASYHQEKFSHEISPIKLQKSLYFCYAYWGEFVTRGEIGSEMRVEQSKYLFKEQFYAGAHGPLIPDIAEKHQQGALYGVMTKEELFKDNILLSDSIHSLLDDMFEISDLKLAMISQDDECWKSIFNKSIENIEELEIGEDSDGFKMLPIINEDIIKEYCYKIK